MPARASVVAGVVALALPAIAAAGGGDALRLAQRYAPILMLKTQAEACGKGEAFRPTSVDVVLANPEVVLRDRRGRVVVTGPTAAQLYGKPADSYLDLPGNPLHPGCGYEREFDRWAAGKPALAYAHVATERGRLALQYWLYYTFNDFNDKHESDWEFVQVVFDAASVQGALTQQPIEVGASQHEGGERAGWDDDKLAREGTHPIVYPGAGSHANYYTDALWLGRSARQGFGCDDTKGPSTRTPLQLRLLPSSVSSARDPDAWLGYAGRWGQKESAFNNGPPGPQTQRAWTEPIEWQDGLRAGAVSIPGGHTLGPTVTSFFCGAVAAGSDAFIFMTTKPWGFLGLALLLLAGLVAAVRRTTWSPADPTPVRAPRDGGQILRAGRRIYLRHLGLFLGIGLIFVPINFVFSAAQFALFRLTGLKDLVAVAGRGNLLSALTALVVGALGVLIASVLVTAAVVAALEAIDEGTAIRPHHVYRRALDRLRALGAAVGIEVGLAVVLLLTVVGIPVAVHLLVRWAFATQACVVEELPARTALQRSAELVRGRWWRVFGITATVNVLAVLSGPIVGLVALFTLTSASLDAINLIGALVYTVTIPLAAIANTLLYFDLVARPARARALRRFGLVRRHRSVHQAA